MLIIVVSVGTGDVTTNGLLVTDSTIAQNILSLGTVDPNVMAVGSFLAKADGVVGGIHIAELVFQMVWHVWFS